MGEAHSVLLEHQHPCLLGLQQRSAAITLARQCLGHHRGRRPREGRCDECGMAGGLGQPVHAIRDELLEVSRNRQRFSGHAVTRGGPQRACDLDREERVTTRDRSHARQQRTRQRGSKRIS